MEVLWDLFTAKFGLEHLFEFAFQEKNQIKTSHMFIIFGLPRAACWFLVSPIGCHDPQGPGLKVKQKLPRMQKVEVTGMMTGWWLDDGGLEIPRISKHPLDGASKPGKSWDVIPY